jgi:hypothetical protein
MEGYEVLAFDGEGVGRIVGTHGDWLVVEQGAIFKKRRPVPAALATVDDTDRVVRTTLSRELVESAPELGDGEPDEVAAARHYGLAAGEEAPATLGYGDVAPGDPAWSAERQEERQGLEPAAARRARTRDEPGPGERER